MFLMPSNKFEADKGIVAPQIRVDLLFLSIIAEMFSQKKASPFLLRRHWSEHVFLKIKGFLS